MGRARTTMLLWAASGAALIGCCLLMSALSPRFGHDVALLDMPVLELVGGGIVVGALFLLLPALIARSRDAGSAANVRIAAWILLAGICMRAAFLGSTPIIEDDNQRYLWDGAVTANGLNPYATAPAEILDGASGDPVLRELGVEAGAVLHRINYPELRSVYPPVAQAAFALAYWIEPFSLDAWRLLVLACDLAAAAFVILLLNALSRPLPWLALYWWNPVVVKELHNSAHMDVLVVLAVVAGLYFAVRNRLTLSAVAVAFGFGAKIWPLLLAPGFARTGIAAPLKGTVPIFALIVLCALFAAPVLMADLDASSGFLAYGGEWQANDALFRAIEWCIVQILEAVGLGEHGRLGARIAVALALVALVLYLNRYPARDAHELCRRAFLTIAALLLLSPTQFPWYFCWLAVLLPLFPVRGFLLLTMTLPLYYSYFHLAPRGHETWFHYGVVALIWAPVWVVLALDWLRGGHNGRHRRHASAATEQEEEQ